MLFIVKVPGHPKPYSVIQASVQAAIQWAADLFPESQPASAKCARGAA